MAHVTTTREFKKNKKTFKIKQKTIIIYKNKKSQICDVIALLIVSPLFFLFIWANCSGIAHSSRAF